MKQKRNGENLSIKGLSKRVACVVTSLSLVVVGWSIHQVETNAAYAVDKYSVRVKTKVTDISDTETLNNVENPGMGFYKGFRMNLTENGDELKEKETNNLLHFRVDISHFSPYYRKQAGLSELSDYHINDKALNALRIQLKRCRDNHRTVIIRFTYDPGYNSGTSYEPEKRVTVGGKTYVVGDSDLINKHQEDLSVVLHEYKDVIIGLEAGLIGQWGEMHSSEKMKTVYDSKNKKVVTGADHYNKIIGKWLDLLDDTEIPVLIRKVEDYINFANANSFKGKNVKHENVGFANITRTKKLKLIFEDANGKTYEYPLSKLSRLRNEKTENGDVRNWLSDDKNTSANEGMTKFKAQVDLKDAMPNGTYKVFLRIADSDDSKGLNGYPVKFANKGKGVSRKKADDKGIWNETLGANYFGSFTILDRSKIIK